MHRVAAQVPTKIIVAAIINFINCTVAQVPNKSNNYTSCCKSLLIVSRTRRSIVLAQEPGSLCTGPYGVMMFGCWGMMHF